MMLDNCYSSVLKLISEASRRFGNQFCVNKAKAENLEEVCEIIEELISEFECEHFDATVNDEEKSLTLSVWYDDIILQGGSSHSFFSLIKMLDSFSFSKSNEDSLRIDMNINRLWVEK